MKRKLAVLLIGLVLLGMIPPTAIQSFAIVVKTSPDGDIEVNDVKYAVTHNVFEMQDGYIEITGENLQDVVVLFGTVDAGTVSMGEQTMNTDNFIKFTFTAEGNGAV